MLYFTFMFLSIFTQDEYLINANINKKMYKKVPQHELIFAKYMAMEPFYFPSGTLKAKALVNLLTISSF